MNRYRTGSSQRRGRPLAASAVLLLYLLAPGARADVAIFENGDQWHGKVISLANGKLTFASDLAGEIVVSARRLQGLYTENEVEIYTKDGNVIYEGLQPDAPGRLLTTGLVDAERLALDISNIESINPPTREAPGFGGRFVAGTEIDRGNTIKDAADLDVRLSYESFRQRIALRGKYEGERTTNTDTGRAPPTTATCLALSATTTSWARSGCSG